MSKTRAPAFVSLIGVMLSALAIPALAAPDDGTKQTPAAASGKAGNARFDPHPLVFGTVHEERINASDLNDPGDRHRWRFEGKAGQGVRIDIKSTDFPAWGYLELNGKSLRSFESVDDRPPELLVPGDAFLEIFLPETGIYESLIQNYPL